MIDQNPAHNLIDDKIEHRADKIEQSPAQSIEKLRKKTQVNVECLKNGIDMKLSQNFAKFRSHKNYLKNLSNTLKSMTKRETAPKTLKTSGLLDNKLIELIEEEKIISKFPTPCSKAKQSKPFVGYEKSKNNSGQIKTCASGFSFHRKLFPNSTKLTSN